MVEAARARMTVEEFLHWESGDDRRYELVDGRILAMAPPAEQHGALVMRLGAAIQEALRGRAPCRVIGEAGMRFPRRGHDFYVADMAVTCAPPSPARRHIENPVLIVEVLSPSTELHDRKVKLPDYRLIRSVEEIALVDSTGMYAEVHRRLDDRRWLAEIVRGADATLRLASVGLELRLGSLYEFVAFEEPQRAFLPE